MAKTSKAIKSDKSSFIPGFIRKYSLQIVVLLFSFLVFANGISNGFNLDDELVTTVNPAAPHKLTAKGIAAIPLIFSSHYYSDSNYAYEYRPFVLATFALQHDLLGDSPVVSHFISVLLYSLSCLLLFIVLSKIWENTNPLFALAITLLYAIHPAHTEVVDNIKCRDEILAMIFSLLALLYGIRYVKEHKYWQLILLTGFFTLALINKVTVISFVVLIPFTLALFCEATLIDIAVISFLLVLPSSLFLNTYSAMLQGIVVGLIFCVNLALYALIHFREIWVFIKNPVANPRIEIPAVSIIPSGFKPLLQNVVPDKSLFYWPAISSALLLTLVYGIGLSAKVPLIIVSSGAALLMVLLFGGTRYSWWGNIFFHLTAIATIIVLYLETTLFASAILFSIIYNLFFARRDLFLPTFLLALGAIVGLVVHGNDPVGYMMFVLYILFFASMYNKYSRVISLFLIVQASFKLIQYAIDLVRGNSIEYNGLTLAALLTLITVVLMFRRRPVYPLVMAVRGFALVLLLFFVSQSISRINDVKTVNPQQSNQLTIITALPTSEFRPLTREEAPVNSSDALDIRIGTSAEVLLIYLGKTMLPYPMAFYYGIKFIEPMSLYQPMPILGIILYLIIGLISLYLLLKGKKTMAFALLWYLISIMVFSDFVVPVPGMLGDRFMYIPSLGWCILVVCILQEISKFSLETQLINITRIPRLFIYAYCGMIILYATLSITRNSQWRDDIVLFTHDVKYVDNSMNAHSLLATHLMVRAEQKVEQASKMRDKQIASRALDEAANMQKTAAEHYEKAILLAPNYFNPHYDLARARHMLSAYFNMVGDKEQRFRYFKGSLDEFRRCLELNHNFLDAEFQIGMLYDEMDSVDQAAQTYRLLLQKEPKYIAAYANLSMLYYRQKMYDSSVIVNKQALLNFPEAKDPIENIAKAYYSSGQIDSALTWMEKSYQLNPNNRPLVEKLYELYKNKGNEQKSAYYANILNGRY